MVRQTQVILDSHLENTQDSIVKGFMKNRSGRYGKTRETLPLARGASACAARGGRERVGVKGLNGIAKTLKKQSIFPSP